MSELGFERWANEVSAEVVAHERVLERLESAAVGAVEPPINGWYRRYLERIWRNTKEESE